MRRGGLCRSHPDRYRSRTAIPDTLALVAPTRQVLSASVLGAALKPPPAGPAAPFEIGDCAMPRTAFEAMRDAAALGHRL